MSKQHSHGPGVKTVQQYNDWLKEQAKRYADYRAGLEVERVKALDVPVVKKVNGTTITWQPPAVADKYKILIRPYTGDRPIYTHHPQKWYEKWKMWVGPAPTLHSWTGVGSDYSKPSNVALSQRDMWTPADEAEVMVVAYPGERCSNVVRLVFVKPETAKADTKTRKTNAKTEAKVDAQIAEAAKKIAPPLVATLASGKKVVVDLAAKAPTSQSGAISGKQATPVPKPSRKRRRKQRRRRRRQHK